MPHNARPTRRDALALGGAALGSATLAGCAAAPARASAPCWTTAGRLPHAVQEIYPALHRGRIHVSGGLLGAATAEGVRAGGVSPHHFAFDPKTGQTAALKPAPAPRHHPQLVDHKGRLYQFGGFASPDGGIAWTMTADAFAYDDAADAWTTIPSSPAPHGECVSASLGDRIHLVGGRAPKGDANAVYADHADTGRHLVFDPAAQTWTTAAPALTPRNSAAAAVIDGRWHVAGGRTLAGPVDAHEIYDPKEDRWRAAAPMPAGSGAGGNAAGAINGELYVFGGEYFQPRPGGVKTAVWRYSPKTDAWEQVSTMATPRHGLGGVTVGDAIFAIGGAARPSGADTTDIVERFSLGC